MRRIRDKRPPRQARPVQLGPGSSKTELLAEIQRLDEDLELERQQLEAEESTFIQSQHDLEDSRDRYAELFDFAPVGFLSVNRSGVVTSANLTIATILQRPREKLLGYPLMALVVAEDRRILTEHLWRVRRQEEGEQHAEVRLRTAGSKVRVMHLASIRRKSAAEPHDLIQIALTDVTERRAGEELLRAREAELRLITSTTPVMLTRCTRDLRYAYVNPAFAKFLKLSPEEIVGRSLPEIMGPAAFDKIGPYVKKVLTGKPVEFESEVPYERIGRRFMRVAYTPEIGADGKVNGWHAALSDITERKQVERRLAANLAVTRILAESPALDSATPRILQTICEMLDWDVGELWMVEPAGSPQELKPVAAGVGDQGNGGKTQSESESRHLDSYKESLVGDDVRSLKSSEPSKSGLESPKPLDNGSVATETPSISRRGNEADSIKHFPETPGSAGDPLPAVSRTDPGAHGVTRPTLTPFHVGGYTSPRAGGNDGVSDLVGVLKWSAAWHKEMTGMASFVESSRKMTFVPGIGLPGRVWESLQPTWIPDVTRDGNFPRMPFAEKCGLHTGFAFPILSEGRFLGAMEFFSREIRPGDEAMIEMFAGVGSQLGQFITRKKSAEALRQAKDELATVNVALEKRVRERTAELTRAIESMEAEIAERKRSELARARLVGIVESAADAILTKTLRGTITSWNKAAERLFGYTAEEIVGRPVSTIIPPDRHDELADLLETLGRGEGAEHIETVRQRKDGRRIDVSLTLSPIKDEAGCVRAASAIMRDISDRKRAEQALRDSEARLQAIMENSPAMIFLKDTEGRYLHFNRLFGQTFHLSLEETIGKKDADLFPPKQAAAFRANDLVVIQAGAPMVFDEVATQEDGPHASIVSKSPLYDADGKIYAIVGIVTDITERKRLEYEVLHVSEREQRRIAQDLHDGLGQQLAGISCLSDVLKNNLADLKSPDAGTAARISKLLDSAVAQTRGLARGLHPVEPEPTGLMSGLQELAVNVNDLFKVACEFQCSPPVPIEDNTVATHLYRIAQEAVTNSLKHGRAQKIRIGLSATPERIILAVGDDGVGMSKRLSRKKKGLGLRIMSYRAGMIGGTLVVQKKRKGGTDVVCTVTRTATPKPKPVSPNKARGRKR